MGRKSSNLDATHRVRNVTEPDAIMTVFSIPTAVPQIRVLIGGEPRECIPDSGAAVNILPKRLLPPKAVVKPTTLTVKAYGGFPLPVIGSCLIPVEHRGRKRDVIFVVIYLPKESPLLSSETCKDLDLFQAFVAGVQQEVYSQ